MKKILPLVCCNLLFITQGLCQITTSSNGLNLSLDQLDNKTRLPAGWVHWPEKGNFLVDSLTKTHGRFSLSIECSKDSVKKRPASITCFIPPARFKGEKIELRGELKFSSVEQGFVGLMIRIDDADGMLASDNMLHKKINGTSDWKQYSVAIPLFENAKSITLGVLLTGTGKIWVDNLQLLVDGKAQ